MSATHALISKRVPTVIHPTAIVDPEAKLGVDCEVQAFAVITKYCEIGDRCVISSHAVIGGDPQYVNFDRSVYSRVVIGARTILREFCTINRSIRQGQATTVGDDCYFMANVHLAHDVSVGKGVVLANNVMLAGHVTMGDFAFVGGGAGLHQYTRVGSMAMISGLSRISQDIAPYVIVSERDEVSGLNLVGLKRRGVDRPAVVELKNAFRDVFMQSGNIRQLAAEALVSGKFVSSEAQRFLAFFAEGKRGFARPLRGKNANIDGNES